MINKKVRLYSMYSFIITCLSCFLLSSSCSKKTPANSANIQRKTALPGAIPTPSPISNPSHPVLNFPIESPYYSSAKTLTLSGTCDSEDIVTLSGAATDSINCINHSFSFVLNQTEDGSFLYSLSQVNKHKLESEKLYFTWTIDTHPPTKLNLFFPTDHQIINNQNLLMISGNCEESTKIKIDGDFIDQTACRDGSFGFVVNKETDGIYNFSLKQKDLAENNSESTLLQWTRDTIAPETPTLQNPITNPFLSGDTKLDLRGLCEINTTVMLRGSSVDSTTCNTQGQFHFIITQTTDGTFSFNISQIDPAGNTSAEQNFIWVRKSQIPSTPNILSPLTNPYYSNLGNLNLVSSCETSNTVTLTEGSLGQFTQICPTQAPFQVNFEVAQPKDGNYQFQIGQHNENTTSAIANFTWVVDTAKPNSPLITNPVNASAITNESSQLIEGHCEKGLPIKIKGDLSADSICASSETFSFITEKDKDGTYYYTIEQTDFAGNISVATLVTWIRDTLAPNSPTITNPKQNPYLARGNNVNLSGNCENPATVYLTGAETKSSPCSENGTFSFDLTEVNDGDYLYQLSQVDKAGNVSTGTTQFQWTRITTMESTPILLTPNTTDFYSNSNTLQITVGCTAGDKVNLTGVSPNEVLNPEGQTTQICPDTQTLQFNSLNSFSKSVTPNSLGSSNKLSSHRPLDSIIQLSLFNQSNQVTFTISKLNDGIYNIGLTQSVNGEYTSAMTSFNWIVDTIKPGVPNLISPTTNPYIAPGNLKILGSCEINSVISLTGDSKQTTNCDSNSQFSFEVSKSEDATYNFAIAQQDLAGNISDSLDFVWTRNSNSLAAPSITLPLDNPHWSNTNNLTVTGECSPGYFVSLLITEDSEQFTQTCSQNSTYSFELNKITDGTFSLALKQSLNSADSPINSLKWIRDTLAPTTVITNKNALPTTNFSDTLAFEFAANESQVRFLCALDSAVFSSCTSPVKLTFSSSQNGQHIWHVKALDLAGNTSEEDIFTWTQAKYNTIVLYHFDNPDTTLDSSLFSTTTNFNNSISMANAKIETGKFKQAVTTGTASQLFVPHNASQNIASDTTTFEAFVKLASLTMTKNQKMVIASKMGASGNYGWEFGIICRNNSGCSSLSQSFSLFVNASQTLNSEPTLFQSSKFNGLSVSDFKHVAFTLSSGILTFYFDGNAKGTATLGSPLTKTTANLVIGGSSSLTNKDDNNKNPNPKVENKFLGTIDEMRWSQGLRYQTSTYTIPAESFTAD